MTPSQHPGVPGVEADGHLVGVGRVLDGDDHAPALPFKVDAGGFAEELGVDAGENRLTGEVLDTEFLGETTRVHLRWEGRRVVVAVDNPPGGEETTVGFDPEDAWML